MDIRTTPAHRLSFAEALEEYLTLREQPLMSEGYEKAVARHRRMAELKTQMNVLAPRKDVSDDNALV